MAATRSRATTIFGMLAMALVMFMRLRDRGRSARSSRPERAETPRSRKHERAHLYALKLAMSSHRAAYWVL